MFTNTVPALIFLIILCALDKLDVQIPEARPKSVELERLTASSSVLKAVTVKTGPNTSF